MSTYKQGAERLIDVFGIGRYGTGTARTTTTFTAAVDLQNTKWGSDEFGGWWLEAPWFAVAAATFAPPPQLLRYQRQSRRVNAHQPSPPNSARHDQSRRVTNWSACS